jgi:large subunit ribosomal protein L9
MKVILLDNIRGIGRVGDIKEVSDGYARNFLLPRGLGKPATEGTVRDVSALKSKKLEAAALAETEARQVAERIQGTVVAIAAKANKQGKLFAGVEADQIAKAISETAGAHITADQLQLKEPLKTVGEHPVTVALTDEVNAPIVVTITAQ